MAVKSIREVNDRDVVLCTLTSRVAGRAITETFIEVGIPFTETWKRVPFYQRIRGSRTREICEVRTHRSQYSRARRTLDGLGRPFLKLVTINVI